MSEMILISGFGVRMVSRSHAFWGADGHPLPQTLGEADIISVSGIIRETTSFAEGKHHSKKRTFDRGIFQ